MNFSWSYTPLPHNLKLSGIDLPWSDSLKFLGVIFTTSLNFNLHIGLIQSKCLKKLNLLKAIAAYRWGPTTQHLIQLANSMISGTIEYASLVFEHAAKYSYNSALHFALGLPKWTPNFKLYTEANSPPIAFRWNYLFLTYTI